MIRSLIHRAVAVAGAAAVVLVALAGVASASGTVALGWSPSGTVSYGTLTPGATGAKTFTLTNTGTSATSALTITLTPAAAFTVTADHCTGKSLGPGKSCSVNVTYTAPAGLGQSSQATLTATGPGKPAVTAPVTLTGATPKATPAITTTQQPARATAGAAVADQATVTGGANPAGTVTFTLYNNPGCTGTALFTDTESLAGGSATSTGYTKAAAGTDYWQATYNGDNSNNQVSSSCSGEPVTITPASPNITTIAQPPIAAVGKSVADKATVTGGFNPAGTVTFTLYDNATCSGTALFTDTESLAGGSATSKGYTPAAVGTDYWQATYNGDNNNNTAVTGCAGEPVTITPAITTTSSAGGPVGATTVTDTATISGGNNPTGTLTFHLYGPTRSQLPDCSGTPVDTETMNVTGNGNYTTPAGATPSLAGTYWWTASYSGDASNPATGSGCGDEPVTITGDLTLSPGDFFDTESPNLNTYSYSLGRGPATQTFTITNNGNTSSAALDLNAGQAASAGFSIGTDNCTGMTLDPGGTCTFDVTFTPPAGCPLDQSEQGAVDILGIPSPEPHFTYLTASLDAYCP